MVEVEGVKWRKNESWRKTNLYIQLLFNLNDFYHK